MDITLQELKTMKAKQLRRLIREAITEVLNEGAQEDKAARDAEITALRKKQAAINAQLNAVTTGKDTIPEGELAEAKTYRLTDPNFDTSAFADRRIRGIAVSDMLNWIKDNPGVSARRFKEQFGFPKEQGANAFLNAFHQSGILTKLGSGGDEITVRQPAAPGEEEESDEVVTGPEALFVGKGDPLAQYFDNVPNADGSEDFNAEEEPTTGIEKAEPTPITTVKGKAAEFTIDNSDLIKRIIDNFSAIKSKIKKGGKDLGDISSSDVKMAAAASKASAEANFPILIKKLADDISKEDPEVQKAILNSLVFKFSSVGYPSLAKIVAKELNMSVSTPSSTPEPIEPEIEDEDTIDEAFNREYELRKLQFYAGIIK